MTVETATYINGLNASYPASGDQKSEGDNHMRLIKSTLKASFPNISGAVSPTHLELNYVAGVTSAIQDQINRTLRQSGGSAVSAIPDAATRANKVLGFDSSGNPVTIIANTDLAAAVTAAGNAATSEANAAASAVAAAASVDTKTTGPASATDNAIARFDGTTGKLLQNSGVFVDDSGHVSVGTTGDNSTRRLAFVSSTGGTTAIHSITDGATNQRLAFSTTFGTESVKAQIDGLGNFAVVAGTGSLGYGTGAGGMVPQGSSSGKATTVTLNRPTGQITMNDAALNAGGEVTFVFNNSLIGINDVLVVGTYDLGNPAIDAYSVRARCSAGAAAITLTNTSGMALSEAIGINFAIIKGAKS